MYVFLLTACGNSTTTKDTSTSTPVLENSNPIPYMIYGFVPSPEGTYIQLEGYDMPLLSQSKFEIPQRCFNLPVKRMSFSNLLYQDFCIPSTIEGRAYGCPYFIDYTDLCDISIPENHPYFEIKDGMLFTKGLKELLYIFDNEGDYVLPKETTKVWLVSGMERGSYNFTVEEGNPIYYSREGKLYERNSSSDVCMEEKEYSDYLDGKEDSYDIKSPENLRSPYEGYSFKIANNDKEEQWYGMLGSETVNQYAVIMNYAARDSVIKLPEKIFEYPTLCSRIYNEYCKELIIPEKFCGFYDLKPDDGDGEKPEWYSLFPILPKLEKITLSGENQLYTLNDNVLFSKDMRMLYGACAARTGSYTVPDSVIDVKSYAFALTNLDEIIINKNLKNISDYAFDQSRHLKRLVLNNSHFKDSFIIQKCKDCFLRVKKVEKHGKQRIFHLEYDDSEDMME